MGNMNRVVYVVAVLVCLACWLDCVNAAPKNKGPPPQKGGPPPQKGGPKPLPSPSPSFPPSTPPQHPPAADPDTGVCNNRFQCQNLRRSDCKRCLFGRRRGLCVQATTQLFNAAGLPPGQRRSQNSALRRKLSLFAGDPDVDNVYCRGFMATFVDDNTNATLNIGDSAVIHSEGAAESLEDILQSLNAPAQVESSVVYSDSQDGGDGEPNPPPPSPLPQGNARVVVNDYDIDDDDWNLNVLVKNLGSIVFIDETKLDPVEVERRLAGSVRIPVSAKQVIRPNGTIRKWVVIQALRRLTQAPGWADAFRRDSSQFKVVRRNGGVYVVFIGFNSNFVREFN